MAGEPTNIPWPPAKKNAGAFWYTRANPDGTFDDGPLGTRNNVTAEMVADYVATRVPNGTYIRVYNGDNSTVRFRIGKDADGVPYYIDSQ